MTMKIKELFRIAGLAVSVVAAIGTCVPVNAAVFNLQYSGASLGNSATATGQIDIDPSALTIGPNSLKPIDLINSLTLTISGATSGNGTFTKNDFSSFVFTSSSPLDFSKELVGQPIAGGIWGETTVSFNPGDFNLFSDQPNVLTGLDHYTLGTFRGRVEQIRLTSFAPVQSVPEPSSLLGLLAIGTLGTGSLLRRKQQQKAKVKV